MWVRVLLNGILSFGLELERSDANNANAISVPPNFRNKSDNRSGAYDISIVEAHKVLVAGHRPP